MSNRQAALDRIGAYASALCAVHCLLTGVFLGLLSVMGLGFLGSTKTEAAFLGVAVVVGLVATVTGHRVHRSLLPGTFFLLGLGCWLTSHLVSAGHSASAQPVHHHTPLGTAFAVAGGLFLVSFHVLNQRLSHRCQCPTCSHP